MTSRPKVVICGAGIAGVAAAYSLMTTFGVEDITVVDQGHPLSLTSDKSTEAYRNWWPGPDWEMTAFMDRSLDLIEDIARATNNRINLNRRGYVFATADSSKIDFLQTMSKTAEARGAGAARFHDTANSVYMPSPEHGFNFELTGADIITDRSLIRRHFPYLSPETVALAHVRRAGWFSAQQLGAAMYETVRARGATVARGEVIGFRMRANRVDTVDVAMSNGRRSFDATHVVLAGGPFQNKLTSLLDVALPITAERHRKVSFQDTLSAMPRSAPMMIWLDEQYLPFSDDERAAMADDPEFAHFLGKFPAGVHGRPDGAYAALVLFNHHGDAVEPTFPLPEEPHYAEIALRGMATMVPALRVYNGRPSRPYVDGGYYMRTRENRPLIGPSGPEGVFVSCAYSGFGIMASAAAGELVASHLMEAPLPRYAPAFLPSRYQDPRYCSALDAWGDGGQL
ncbi:MAG: FAD-binding oxidoreductase [Pseudolabrys sp.]|nr:FAD-binding oxidoreductase [Pseudolabrys sp.]MBV9262648.1 FAD-binding oxidoreductase [Pseudolabrys sp.]